MGGCGIGDNFQLKIPVRTNFKSCLRCALYADWPYIRRRVRSSTRQANPLCSTLKLVLFPNYRGGWRAIKRRDVPTRQLSKIAQLARFPASCSTRDSRSIRGTMRARPLKGAFATDLNCLRHFGLIFFTHLFDCLIFLHVCTPKDAVRA